MKNGRIQQKVWKGLLCYIMFRYVTKIQRTKVEQVMNQIYNSVECPRLSNHWNIPIKSIPYDNILNGIRTGWIETKYT